MTPEVNAAVWALRPDYVAVSIVARGCRNEVSSAPARIVSVDAPRPAWAEAHLASWREAYRSIRRKTAADAMFRGSTVASPPA